MDTHQPTPIHHEKHAQLMLPCDLTLPALEQTWRLEKMAYLGRAKWIARPNQSLILLHPYEDDRICHRLVIAWLRYLAELHFEPWLREVSQTCGLPFNKMTIRAQQRRWGSCSIDKNISVNVKCLFFPKSVVRYLFVHELCHTVHMNHSQRFWGLVKKHDPHYRKHDTILKKEREFLPEWI